MEQGSYLAAARDALGRIAESQQDALERAAGHMAASIAAGRLVHLFGTGHGSFAPLESFPRSGGIVGFHPIVELPLTLLHHVYGDMGVPQYRLLHRQEGYGQAILESHHLDPRDCLALFSHSGLNAVILDMAVEARRRGLTVIGVTSLPHTMAVQPRHSSGQRLADVADVVIDTGVPLGDACVRVDGVADPLGPLSTVCAVALLHELIVRTCRLLVAQGVEPFVEVNVNVPREGSARAQNNRNYAEQWRRQTLVPGAE